MDILEQTVELFCGSEKTFSSLAGALGYATFTVDVDAGVSPDLVADIRNLEAPALPARPLIVWAAPPSSGFAAEHWNGIDPVDVDGERAMDLFRATMRVLLLLEPAWWFIESPRGVLRDLPVLAGFNRGYPSRNRQTIRQDQYGGASPLEIDVWTNAFWWIPRPGEADGTGGSACGRRLPPLVYAEVLDQLDAYRRTGSYGPR